MGKSKKDKVKKSGVRTKFLIESLRGEYYDLREENETLRQIVSDYLPPIISREILADCFDPKAAKVNATSIDELAAQMAGNSVDDDDDAVGF